MIIIYWEGYLNYLEKCIRWVAIYFLLLMTKNLLSSDKIYIFLKSSLSSRENNYLFYSRLFISLEISWVFL